MVQKPDAALTDDNASVRIFAHTLSEEELFHESQRRYAPMFSYPPDRPVVFVKFGGLEKQAEGDMQRLAFGWLSTEQEKKPHCNVYIPEVYKIFSRHGVTFIVMQFIEASSIQDIAKQLGTQHWEDRKSKYYDLIAEGIQLLRGMPLPSDPTPGPRTSSRRIIKHMLFKDHEAPVEYDTIEELQDHLNRVVRLGYCNNLNLPVVDLEKELVFCYTDFNDENFMFTTDADRGPRLYIVDFEHASFLPGTGLGALYREIT
ncbi:Uncharacterized protein BP5553_03863 [Venustampulla echinocandica]|uniref:Aminoglycoside phosphotransferase domain-containing protein n=1 Tax=Venustampulla echinocandica TaxID=2656787 RepID=A0A370TVG1_9HELO|nr:Uncharacterized protein BP5553_03863 [Venustampulla echinocandica]RDL39523.1 Uncharacterized protein BP5553_03863 [Venustampulla echinocandica]